MSTTSRSVPRDRARPVASVLLGLAIVATLAWPASALADDAAPIQLTWEAPASCPSSDAVLAKVRKIAGKIGKDPAPLQAEAFVTENTDHQFALRLVVRSGALVGERSFKGRSCSDLVGALAIALAVILSSEEPLDEQALKDASPPVAEPASRQPAPENKPPPAAADAARDPRADEAKARRLHGLLTLPLFALSVGPQHHTSRGLGAAAGISFEDWRMLAEGKLWASRNATPWAGDESGAELNQLTVSLRGCRRVSGVRLELSPCLLVSMQHLSARGTGPHIEARTPATTWVAVGAGLRARLLITPWLSLVAQADGELQLSRPEVKLEDVGLVERLSPFAGTFAMGPEWIL
jgi:hypothetical protein